MIFREDVELKTKIFQMNYKQIKNLEGLLR